jgi:hypothetical protein
MKGIYRHYSTYLLLLGIMVSFVAFLNGTNIYQQINIALQEVNEYQYKYSYYIGISDIKDIGTITNELSRLTGNVVVTDCVVYLDDNFYHDCEIILKQNENLPYPVEIINENGEVIIGEELEKLCFEENGISYISINNSAASVKGIVSSEKSDLLNYKLIITENADNVDKYFSDSLSLAVEYGSNTHDTTEEVGTFCTSNFKTATIYYEKEDEKYIEVGSQNADEKFYLIIAIFAMVNCVVISEFWILRRKQEIIIRKLWGFSNIKIFKMLYGQMMVITVAAILLVLLGQLVTALVQQSYGDISLYRLVISILFVVAASFIIVLLPIYKSTHFKISDGLEE